MFVWKRGRRAVAVLAVLALTMAVLAGCGQKQGAQQPGAQAPGAPAPKAPVTFVFGRGADSDRIDPARTTSGESANVTVNIFDTLVEYQDETSDIQAGLAEKWEPSSDGKVWTFNLRKGVVFHDGTPLNAEAVKFNFDRQMDKKSPYHTNDMEYADFSLDLVEKVEAVDEYTVKFTLKYPFGPFLRNIAMFSNGIVSPEAVKKYGEESFKHPVGTGPFKFESWNKDSEIVLVKNDKYWREGPYVDRLVFKVIPDNNVRLAELEAGSIQAMDGVDPNYVDKIKSNPNLVLYSKPGLNINYMMFPTDVAPWNNKKLRKAVSHAINKDEIVQYLYKGAAAPAVGALPPGMLGYYPELKAPEYDPEKARKLLAEAGFPKGLKTTLMAYPNPRLYNPAGARLVEMIQQMLDKIGVTADIQQMEWSTYLAESKKGFKSPGFLGWMGDNGDPDNFLFVLFDTKSIPGGNRSRYSNPKVDDLLLQAQQTMDESKRFELYKQAQEIVSDDAPIVPISHGNAMAATRSNVKGFKLHLLSINRFRGVKIE